MAAIDTSAVPTRHRKKTPTWAVVAVLALCGTVVALQQTLVVPLLPDFPGILGVPSDDVSWLITATLLTSAIATPIMSRLADMFGKRLMMIVSMAVMTVGSILAAVGGDFVTLVAGRSLQGFGAALIPIGISILRDELPREKVGSAVALMSATLGIGSALGLPMSGIIYQQLGWQAIFWISAAAGAALIIAVLSLVPESTIRTGGRFDFGGAVLLTIALVALLLAISKGGSWGWGSEPVIVLFVITAVALLIWFPYELKVSQPLVDLRTSARRPVLLTNLASVLVGFAMFANLLLTTQQLQLPEITGYGFGLTVAIAGLAMVPSGLAMVLFAPVSGGLINRYGGRITLIIGSAVLGLAYIGRVFYSNSVPAVIIGATCVSIGTAIAYAAMPTLIMSSVPRTETASANGLNSLLRAIGTSTSSAAVAAVLASVTMQIGPTTLPTFGAFQDVFWMAGISALIAGAVAWFIPASRRVPEGKAPLRTKAGEQLPAQPGAPEEDQDNEIVVGGRVLQLNGTPVHPAVITVMRTDGTPVDWSRADNDGNYSVVLPAAGEYLVLANAQGWTPRAEVFRFIDETIQQHITLTAQLMLSGTVSRADAPIAEALVALSEATGEVVGSVRTDDAGHYRMPLPAAGRYIVTVLEPDTLIAHARKIVLDVRSVVVDVEVPIEDETPLPQTIDH